MTKKALLSQATKLRAKARKYAKSQFHCQREDAVYIEYIAEDIERGRYASAFGWARAGETEVRESLGRELFNFLQDQYQIEYPEKFA